MPPKNIISFLHSTVCAYRRACVAPNNRGRCPSVVVVVVMMMTTLKASCVGYLLRNFGHLGSQDRLSQNECSIFVAIDPRCHTHVYTHQTQLSLPTYTPHSSLNFARHENDSLPDVPVRTHAAVCAAAKGNAISTITHAGNAASSRRFYITD
jgi:hypothetical protein